MEDNKDEVSTNEVSTNKEHKNWFERNEEGFHTRLAGWMVGYLFMFIFMSAPIGSFPHSSDVWFLIIFGGGLFELTYALYKHIRKQLKEILMFMGTVVLAIMSVFLLVLLVKISSKEFMKEHPHHNRANINSRSHFIGGSDIPS